jgi:hypothetical protein
MPSFAVVHRSRGLIQIVDGSRADAMSAAADLTDQPIWYDTENGQQQLDYYVRGGIPLDGYEVVVVPVEERDGRWITRARTP